MVANAVSDRGRLTAVAEANLLDTAAEVGFDRIAALAARLLATPFGFITVVDDQRSFWKACIGVDATDPADRQNQVGESFCQYVIGLDDELLVDDTRLDERTRDNPSIVSMGVLAWAGVPLRAAGGEVLGTVCVVDTRPREWSRADAELLHDLAAIAADEVRSRQGGFATVRAQALLSAVLERAPVGFALVDDQLQFEMINDTMAGFNGLSAERHIGRTIAEVLPDVSDEVVALVRNVIETGQSVTSMEVSGTTAAAPGLQQFWSANFYRLEIGDGRRRAGLFVEDVTARATSVRRARRLADIAGKLAASATLEDVAVIVGTDLAPYLDAVGAVAGVVDPFDSSVTLLGSPDILGVLEQQAVTINDDTAYGEAYRTNQLTLVSDHAERVANYGVSFDYEWAATAAVPCRNASGAAVGVFVIGWGRRIERDDFPIDQLLTLAGILGQALERIRISSDRNQLIDVLQRTLLDPTPTSDGFDIATRYIPAASAIGFGGDWYDVIRLDGHRTAFVVGDVVGHDPAAAARMAEFRTVIRSLVCLGVELSDVFDQAEALLSDHGRQSLATVAVALVDTDSNQLFLARAGHLPVAVCRPGAEPALVVGALRPPLGVGGHPFAVDAVEFGPGCTLVAFTDGLIETRGETIDDDLAVLTGYLRTMSGRSVVGLADGLIGALERGDGWADDVALVVARRAT